MADPGYQGLTPFDGIFWTQPICYEYFASHNTT
jgi:hypothetical protein